MSQNNNYGRETVAILDGLNKIHQTLVTQNNVLIGDVPDNVKAGNTLITGETLSLTSTFTDTVVNIQGYNLITLSTNADARDISFKVIGSDAITGHTQFMQFDTKIVGYNLKLLISNNTTASGKSLYINKYLVPNSLASSVSANVSSYIHADNVSSGQSLSNLSLSTLANMMTVDEYNSNINPYNSFYSIEAISLAERTADVTSSSINIMNNSNLYVYLYVTASTGSNLSASVLLSDEISGDDIGIFVKGDFGSSKLFLLSQSSFTNSASAINSSLEAIGNVPIPRKIKVKINVASGTHTCALYLVSC